ADVGSGRAGGSGLPGTGARSSEDRCSWDSSSAQPFTGRRLLATPGATVDRPSDHVSKKLRGSCYGVPYVGASARQVEHVLSLLRGRPGKTVDLGSGDGRIVLAAHRSGLRPAVGYELNPWLVGLARLHAWRAGCAGSVCYRREDLWKVDLRDCRNVSVFLAPSVLAQLEDKLQAELPEGARVVSGRFPLPTWQPVAVMGEGVDRVWAYDFPRGGLAGQVSPGPSCASAPGPSNSQVG
uniref:Hydroxyacylglutathione hydrolase like n=1 Tax=Neovison vison TaxID=452646 RepID=A0A8C7BBB7_NEOVI